MTYITYTIFCGNVPFSVYTTVAFVRVASNNILLWIHKIRFGIVMYFNIFEKKIKSVFSTDDFPIIVRYISIKNERVLL